jgi:hypothetical protein
MRLGLEGAADARQRRQVEIHRHRAERRQQGKEAGEGQRIGTQHAPS